VARCHCVNSRLGWTPQKTLVASAAPFTYSGARAERLSIRRTALVPGLYPHSIELERSRVTRSSPRVRTSDRCSRNRSMSGAIRPPASASSFARANDFFFYKRLKDVAEFTEASSLGASLTLCGMATIVLLFIMELVAFLTVSVHQELVLAPHSTEPITVTFNVTFPSLKCDLLSLNAKDVLGSNQVNISRNVHKYAIDGATGRALMRVNDHAFGAQVRFWTRGWAGVPRRPGHLGRFIG
jgi:hypothetical protein